MEIERKYLVDEVAWNELAKPAPKAIAQGYMISEKDKTIRVRIKGSKGFITIKGETHGISRTEYEYEIPVEDAKQLLHSFCKSIVEKDRYEIHYEGFLWEVDIFYGANKGLMMAEVELKDETEMPAIPHWIKEEVSHDPRYFNSYLAKHPFTEW